ncbi:cytochrome b-c1 complex subunit 9 [Aspergillus mulundensis]|uniref:Complex III subunit 9 n=1 Tax=Aspergillus mulundensis TaxID=1810919 RepID=A0A3D8T5C3_9EURO|nr:putative UQCRX like ubiquinol-cytochrome C reductase family protein [Aspergillus mulundensis]RDW93753.1 putative UQCRX like ubiquinol-cytochrome C reductase family protein [Aspergillus mulundensis]
MAGALATSIYQHVSPPQSTLIRRNAVYLTSIFAGAFAFEVAYDTSTNKLWDTWNRGRQWKDIKHQYLNKADEEDDE